MPNTTLEDKPHCRFLCSQELDDLKTGHAQLQEQHRQLLQQPKSEPDEAKPLDQIAELTEQLQQARQDLSSQRAKTLALQRV